ncbi:hypothetical protein GGR54DRAFT_121357 [Hypoxylon sp. NC1633]|nr:hypothetical protein GGR54DRAFT_121357 [Hypoxylon sp. NC1633]
MFGSSRKHRPPNPPLNAATANPNAASAAATAFMSASNHNPGKSLSSAAAAAALRARPHTPTNVGEVQTKRTIRRSTSVSSAGSAPAAAASRPTARLERKGSSGSMTERTFRSPSPSPHRASMQATEERPPVPQIPPGHKKSASLASAGAGMQPFRTASQKMKAKHTSWYTKPSGDPSNVRTSDAPMKTEKPQFTAPQSIDTTTPQRPDSRSSSVNFSYPTVFRAQSPPASPTSAQAPQFSSPPPRTPASPPRSNRASISSITSAKSDQPMVYDPNSRRMIPKAIVDNVGYRVKEAAEKQPRKKKGTKVHSEGTHLAKGTVARIKGTTVDGDAVERDLPKREQPVFEMTPTKEESRILEEPSVKAIITTSERSEHQQEIEGDRSSDLRSPQESRLRSPPPSHGASYDPMTNSPTGRTLGKRPSVVHEEPDEVSGKVDPMVRPSRRALDALDAVPTRQSIYQQPEDSQDHTADIGEISRQEATGERAPEKSGHPLEATKEKKAVSVENKPIAELARQESRMPRSKSNSPARQAHFSESPSDNLVVQHTPLPRSASPIKPALKHTSPTAREVSPSDKSSDQSESRVASPNQQEETAVPRKKSVRVSFDDRAMATVVGESAAAEDDGRPIPASPQQAKRPWYSNIGRSKKREITLDDDEVMKPRPALPSFGSIREKKTGELGERPLVRPNGPNHSQATPSSPELHPSIAAASSDTGTPEDSSLGQSNDHAIGSILIQEQTSRNAPNISKFREPLPPVVTSVEGSGYISDSVRSSDSDDDLLESTGGASDTEEIPSTQATQLETQDNSQNNSTILEEKKPLGPDEGAQISTHSPEQDIPAITIIQPSPRVLEQNTPTASSLEARYFDVPGGFPEDGSDGSRTSQDASRHNQGEAMDNSFTSPVIFEPKAVMYPVQAETLPQTTLVTTGTPGSADDESADESDSSIYSDARDHLTDAEGDGFLSLDAVIQEPIDNTPSQLPELPGDVPEVNVQQASQANEHEQPRASTQSPEPPRDKDDWEQAKAFWRSLTSERRLQLEREALEEKGAEGDREEAMPYIQKDKKASQRQQDAKEAQPRTSAPASKSGSSTKPKPAHTTKPESNSIHTPASPPPTSSRMRMSLRAEKPSHATRPQSSDGIRKTLRSHPRVEQVGRPSTSQAAQHEKSAALSRANQRQETKTLAQASPTERQGSSLPSEKPVMQRRGSDASDSSFKRNRATRNEGFAFRGSMRSPSVGPSQDAAKGSGRFSLRSLSPTGSTSRHNSNPIGSPPAGMTRRNLRSSSVSSHERILPSIHLPSFGRSAKAPTTKRSRKSNRLNDLSDEEEGGVTSFRSRFDDSSDDEEPVRPGSSSNAGPLSRGTLRGSTTGPVGFRKSTPVPEMDEDSPDLPDSDDEMPSPLQSPRNREVATGTGMVRSNSEALGTATLTRSRSGRGGFTTTVSAPATPIKERRTSLMGILRRNKRADQTSKIQRSEFTESAARRDTKLERSNGQLKDLRGDQPSSPRLQKRSAGRRNDSWPLAEGEGVKRSSSAGDLLELAAAGAVQRPGLNGKRTTSLGLPTAYDNGVGNVVADGSEHKKKKKFGALRRMFGLDS